MAWWLNNRLLLIFVEPLASILATIVFTLTFLLLFPAAFARVIILAHTAKKPVRVESTARVQNLGAKTLQIMHVERNLKFAARNGYSGAYSGGNSVVVGEQLLRVLSDEEIVGIVGHEIGHLLRRHILVKALISIVSAMALIVAFFEADQPAPYDVLAITALATFTLARIPLFWKLEYDADAVAAEHLGVNAMVSMLQRLKMFLFDGVSFSHPPLSRRIRRLQTMTSVRETPPKSVLRDTTEVTTLDKPHLGRVLLACFNSEGDTRLDLPARSVLPVTMILGATRGSNWDLTKT